MDEQHHSFEQLKQVDEGGMEYWSARSLAKLLDYSEYRHFLPVLARAKEACSNSGHAIEDHFEDALGMVVIGSGAQRELQDVRLSRYACYLVVQNGDPSKPVIAAGQTYFAVQTRRQELANDAAFQQLKEDQKRLLLRNELREYNKQLVEAAQQAGVVKGLDFAIFQNHGYQGLYGGLDQKAIHRRKGLKKSQKILDHNPRQAAGQRSSLRNRQQGSTNHRRAGRDHARGSPYSRKQYQADRIHDQGTPRQVFAR
ncbi:DNA damage-inducible protein D [Pseudomonas delhiensis]|uniref:DNA damage-inducible protein D n=1 Tax=Pseudomonas delhiensis TaxID=366289 RepID=UPI003159ED0F